MCILNRSEKPFKRMCQTYGERPFGKVIEFVHGDESFRGTWGDRLCRRNDDLFVVLNLCLAQYANNFDRLFTSSMCRVVPTGRANF